MTSNASYPVRGFTLTEVLITLCMVTMIGIVLVDLLRGYYLMTSLQEGSLDVNLSANNIAQELHMALLQAGGISGSHTFPTATLTTGTSTLVVQMPAIDSSGNIISYAYDFVGFYATGTAAYELTDAASSSARHSGIRKLSGVLQSMSFTYNNWPVTAATSASIIIKTIGGGRDANALTQSITEEIGLRNSTL